MHPTRIFKTPEDLEKAFEEYKAHLNKESAKWVKVQYVGKDGDRVEDKYKLPYTFEGFKVFCYKTYGNIEQYFVNKDGLYNDFVSICSRIKEEIRNDQITGGLLGVYNPSITQRLNGLTDKTSSEHNINVNKLPDWLSNDLSNGK
ncbi:MAG: hypothetical protein EBS55_03040 [Flavobacteriaceae bacterium]|nr:hypothetical protein [Flavobacteriaceae bacterium]